MLLCGNTGRKKARRPDAAFDFIRLPLFSKLFKVLASLR
jgi:hypothetical protein